jgi:membrane protein required for beta-lactamase induction
MSALSGNPHRIRDAERTLVRTTVESFWAAVALALGLLAFFAMAGGSTVVTGPTVVVGLVLVVLWSLHARSVRHHPEAVHADERWRHARERRGF